VMVDGAGLAGVCSGAAVGAVRAGGRGAGLVAGV
jgi:hypothetical protein